MEDQKVEEVGKKQRMTSKTEKCKKKKGGRY